MAKSDKRPGGRTPKWVTEDELRRRELRKANLKKLVAEQFGGEWISLAKRMKLANASSLHQLKSENRPFSDYAARNIERKLSLKSGWLDTSHDNNPVYTSQNADMTLLEKVMGTIESVRKDENISPDQLVKKHGRLVVFAVEDAEKRGFQSDDWYRGLLRLLLKD